MFTRTSKRKTTKTFVVVALDKLAVTVVRGILPVVLSIWAMRKRRIVVALLLLLPYRCTFYRYTEHVTTECSSYYYYY